MAHVTDNASAHRYEFLIDDRVAGWIDYERVDGIVSLVHAEVEPELRNEGVGERMVRETLDDLRGRGLRARPICPFVAAYVRRHFPDVQDIVA